MKVLLLKSATKCRKVMHTQIVYSAQERAEERLDPCAEVSTADCRLLCQSTEILLIRCNDPVACVLTTKL